MRIFSINTRVAIVVLISSLIVLDVISTRLAEASDNKELATAEFTDTGNDRLVGKYFKWSVFTVDRSKSTRFQEIDCQAPSPPALLYGCGKGHDGNQLSSAGGFGTVGALEFSIGYRPSSTTRREVSVLFHPNFRFRGNANFKTRTNFTANQPVEAKSSSLAIMFSQILEFPINASDSSGSLASRIKPFIGFGVGVSRTKLDQTTMNLPNNYSFVPGDTKYNLAWMLMTGISTPVSDRVTLEFSLRYTQFGEVLTGKGDILIDFKNPSRNDITVGVHPTKATLSTTGFQMALRYSF